MKTLIREIRDDAAGFWSDARNGVLSLTRCTACGRLFHYPRLACIDCGGQALERVPARGTGVVHAFTVVRYSPFGEHWAADVPYCVAQIDLEEGVRMLSRLVDCVPESVRIGDAVQVVFVHTDDGEHVIPCFRPAAGAA